MDLSVLATGVIGQTNSPNPNMSWDTFGLVWSDMYESAKHKAHNLKNNTIAIPIYQ